ncbi:acyltransferase [Shewanella baltica]|uniref:acyltransferase n=1 Tax=Shewanella baltica TaxID=62322 RepID=UPI003D79D18E
MLILKIKKKLLQSEPGTYNFYLFQLLLNIKNEPVFGLFGFIIKYIYSIYLSNKLFGPTLKPRVFFRNNIFKVKVIKDKRARVKSNVEIAILFESFCYGRQDSFIQLQSEANLEINNTFSVGDGCKVILQSGSSLKVGGASVFQSSGITSNSTIICSSQINIGEGSIISWGVYISDTSNHKISGHIISKPVFIGNHVWISEGVTVSPGSYIGNGSIVGSKSFVNSKFPENSLIVGVPAVLKKGNINWER